MNSFNGVPIVVSPDRPRLVLCAELVPGLVPWPPGFKEDMDAWLLEFFGTWNLLRDGEVLTQPGKALYMNPRTFEQVKAALRDSTQC